MRFWYYICNWRKTSSLSYKIEVLVVHLNPNKTETSEELLSVSDNTSDHWIFVQLPLTLDKYRDVRANVSIISVKWSCDYHLQWLFCCCHYHWPCRNHCQCHCYCHYFWTVIVNCQSYFNCRCYYHCHCHRLCHCYGHRLCLCTCLCRCHWLQKGTHRKSEVSCPWTQYNNDDSAKA